MIETKSDCTGFQEDNADGDLILHIVPAAEGCHPVVNSPSLLFIKNTLTKNTYYYSFDHPDSTPVINKTEFVDFILRGMKNKMWVVDKKSFRQMLDFPNVFDLNLCGFLYKNDVVELSDYETSAHNFIRRSVPGYDKVNRIIPLIKHKEMFETLCEDIIPLNRKFVPDDAYINFDKLNMTLGELEKQGIKVNRELFQKRFEIDAGGDGIVRSQYNVFTSTGRPSNRFGGVNYAALNHNDGSRSCFISRYGKDGKMIVIDYSAFHPRIICLLTKYLIPLEIDPYEYLAKLYFQKKSVDETDISNAKQLTFRQFYGAVEEKYSHIKYLSNLKIFIEGQWEFFQKNGYIETPIFKRKITDKHIQDPNPTKVFNYILQAVEGEIAIPRIQVILDFLKDKKTKAVLYTYDAVLYDFHKDDGLDTLNKIRQIMSCDGMFSMKTYIGDSYQDVRLVNI